MNKGSEKTSNRHVDKDIPIESIEKDIPVKNLNVHRTMINPTAFQTTICAPLFFHPNITCKEPLIQRIRIIV